MSRRRRRRAAARCRTCGRPIVWFGSPFSRRWRTFEPGDVDGRAHTGAKAYPVEGARAWVFRELVEDFMVRRQCSEAEATDEVYAMRWFIPHDCPNRDSTEHQEHPHE